MEVEMMIMPRMMTAPPMNMPFLRPSLSEMMEAKGAPTIDPLKEKVSLEPPLVVLGGRNKGDKTHTV